MARFMPLANGRRGVILICVAVDHRRSAVVRGIVMKAGVFKIALLVCAALLGFGQAGCAPVDRVTDRNTVGQPPAYVDGYRDGCGSGYVATGHLYASAAKDVERYISDQVYKIGWDDGFATCKGSYDSIQL